MNGFWGYGDETGYVRFELDEHRLNIRHERCGFSREVSYEEFQRIDKIGCPNCNVVLASYSELIQEIDQGLGASHEIEHRRRRMHTRRGMLQLRKRLLGG